MRFELKRIQRRLRVTTIYVTHDQTEAMTLADRIVLMRDGKVVQEGSPKDLYHKPINTRSWQALWERRASTSLLVMCQ